MILEYGKSVQGIELVFHELSLAGKECRKCTRILPISSFHKTNNHSSGTVSFCQSCIAAYQKTRRKNTRIRLLKFDQAGEVTHSECRQCKLIKPASSFNRHKKGKCGISERCVECISDVGASYRSRNRAKVILRARNYYRNNKDKVKVQRSVRRYGLRAQAKIIKYFRKELDALVQSVPEFNRADTTSLVIDHIIPLKHPNICGLHCPANLRVISASENSSKQNKWDGTYENSEWRTKWRSSI